MYPHAAIGPSGEGVADALAVVLLELGRRLVARGCRVGLFIRRLPGEPIRSLVDGIEVHRIAQWPDHLLFRLRVLDNLVLPADRPLRVSALYYPFFARRVARSVARTGYDIVHLHNHACFLPVFRQHAPRSRLVLHQHDHALADFALEATRRRLALADLVLACSDHVRTGIEARFPEHAGRWATLHNGVDARFLEVASDPGAQRDVLFVGRLAPEKGADLLIEAFDRIADRHSGSRLVLVGPIEPAPANSWIRSGAIRPSSRSPVSSSSWRVGARISSVWPDVGPAGSF